MTDTYLENYFSQSIFKNSKDMPILEDLYKTYETYLFYELRQYVL